MANNTVSKRSRASVEQLSRMVDFMFESPGLACGKFQKLHGKFETDKKWQELADTLNSVSGAVKTVDQWHTVWRDLKSRTSLKWRDRKRQQRLTGNRPVNQEHMTDLEKRVIALIGSDYVEGHEPVVENELILDEHQLSLEGGDDIFELEMPSTSFTSKDPIASSWDTADKNTPRQNLKRKHVEEDESGTKAQFLEIARKQADALKMLAESSSANAEANKMMAEAIKTMGEGLKANAESFNNMANAINRLNTTSFQFELIEK